MVRACYARSAVTKRHGHSCAQERSADAAALLLCQGGIAAGGCKTHLTGGANRRIGLPKLQKRQKRVREEVAQIRGCKEKK